MYSLSSVTQFLWCSQITLEAVGQHSEHSCSCTAGKASVAMSPLCSSRQCIICSWAFTRFHLPWPLPVNHRCGIDLEDRWDAVSSIQIIHYLSRGYEHFLYDFLFSFQGIHPEAVSDLVVKKPKSVGKTRVKSTIYRVYAGKTFVLHTVKRAHYDKMHIRIYCICYHYNVKNSLIFI